MNKPLQDFTMLAAGQIPPVSIDDLHVAFRSDTGKVHAVNGVSFNVAQGEVLSILGESGSGKSVTIKALMGLLPRGRTEVRGAMRLGGKDVTRLPAREMQKLRGKYVSMIFQEPMTALDPVFTIRDQICEMVMHHEHASRATANARALELLELVQIPSARRRLDAYPHELSGGLRQRAMIAMALSCRPKVLLADEPTTALDATVQIQILLLLRQLQQEMGMSVIFITHDLGVCSEIADKIAVMYAGQLVETGPVIDVLENPRHPYTRALIASTVDGQRRGEMLDTIPGAPPRLETPPAECSFAPRCAFAQPACRATVPEVEKIGPGRAVRCIRHREI